MLRRPLCFLICAFLALLPAASLAGNSFTMAGYDGEDSPHDWATNQFFTRMEERTGVSFTFQEYTNKAEWQAAKEKMFASGELPDVLFKAALTDGELISGVESGLLINLAPLLPEYAPNLWALLQSHPDWLRAITLPGGAIGALPGIRPTPPQNALWINQEWLQKLGLSMPTDFRSLREVLLAFLERDPNGNGKRDEVPLSFLGPWELKFFSHAYGVVANDYNLYVDTDGTVRYWPDEDSFFALAGMLRELYADRLLDQNGFSAVDALRRETDENAAPRYGAFFAPTPLSLLSTKQAQAYAVVEPFVYNGQQVYRELVSPVTRGAFAITSACADPAALLRWADVLYTPEGAAEAMLGREGESYIVDKDGYWQWKGGAQSLSMSAFQELTLYDTGGMPWLFPQSLYARYAEESSRKLVLELERLAPFIKSPFPAYTLTTEESARARELQSRLGAYVDEALARFVLGQQQLTEDTITAFRLGLRERGLDETLAFWQDVADRQRN